MCRRFDSTRRHQLYAWLRCGSGSVVERHLAKVNVASSNLVFRSNLKLASKPLEASFFVRKRSNSGNFFTVYHINRVWRHSQVVRQRSATPLSPVQIWVAPPGKSTNLDTRLVLFSTKSVFADGINQSSIDDICFAYEIACGGLKTDLISSKS